LVSPITIGAFAENAENGARAKKKKDGGRGGEGRKSLQTNPWILITRDWLS